MVPPGYQIDAEDQFPQPGEKKLVNTVWITHTACYTISNAINRWHVPISSTCSL